MNHIEREMLTDCSGPDSFCFSLRCAQCGGTWKSRPVRFSKAGIVPRTDGKTVVYDTLYRQEKEFALAAALRQAEESFNLCPICRRLVCDRCFLLCEDLDMCVDCAARLKEKGEPVLGQNEDPESGK